jgi:Na+-driven multidrug efflux pump
MRNATVISALIGFLPLVWLSLVFDWGLAGIWSGLSAFSGRWAVTGPIS